MEFSTPPELQEICQNITSFMDEHVYANESLVIEDEGLPVDIERDLQQKVKTAACGPRT